MIWLHVLGSPKREPDRFDRLALMGMTSNPSGYQIRHRMTGEMLTRHRTRQAVLDNWRRFPAIPVKIVRVYSDGTEVVMVDGTWEPKA